MDLFAMLMHAATVAYGDGPIYHVAMVEDCLACHEVAAFLRDNASTRDVVRRHRKEFSLEGVRCARCRRRTHTIVFLFGLMYGPKCAAMVES